MHKVILCKILLVFSANLDKEDTLDDSSDEYLISMDSDFPIMFSMPLKIPPSNENIDSQTPFLEIIVIPTIMDVFFLTSHHPSPSILD